MGFKPVGKVVADHGLGGAVKFKYYNEDAENFYRYSSLITNKNERQAELKLTEVNVARSDTTKRYNILTTRVLRR